MSIEVPDPRETANPADALPARTTPTWEVEILLSGASVFALFQIYDALQRALYDLFERMSPSAAGLLGAASSYVQAGVLALALGFLFHLLIRAFWAAAVGLQSIDAAGTLGRTKTVGPAQRALLARRWEQLPARIAELDDGATIVFATSLGLAKLMVVLVVTVTLSMLVGWLVSAASNGALSLGASVIITMLVPLAPFMFATMIDSQRGKKDLPPSPWTERVLAFYSALGMSADGNLGLQMLVHRLSKGQRSFKGTFAIIVMMTTLMLVVAFVPIAERVGVGGLLKGGFPSLVPGQAEALRANHYLDRLPVGAALRVPALQGEVAEGPWLRLFIPYVPHWHDAELARCRTGAKRNGTNGDWRLDPVASAAVLGCLAKAMPITLDERPVAESWVFAEDRRRDRRGFLVMIDIRALPEGRHRVEVAQPKAALEEDEPALPWVIPFWK